MGINIYAEKGKGKSKIGLCFGRSYHFKGNDNMKRVSDMNFEDELDGVWADRDKGIEKLKGYVKYSPKSIEDAELATEDFEGILEDLLDEAERLGSIKIFAELQQEGFKFSEE